MRIQQTSAYSVYNSRPQNKVRNENRVGFGNINNKDALAVLEKSLPEDFLNVLKGTSYITDAKIINGEVKGEITTKEKFPLYKSLSEYLEDLNLEDRLEAKAVVNCINRINRYVKAGYKEAPAYKIGFSDPLPKGGMKEEDLYK